MAALPSLEVQFIGNLVRLQKDVEEAKRVVRSGVAEMKGALDTLKEVAGLVGLGLGLEQIKSSLLGLAEAADHVGKAAQQVGLTTDAYQELRYAFKQGGVDQGEFETGMKRLSVVLDQAAQGVPKAVAELAQFGITQQQVKTGAIDTTGALLKIADGFRGAADDAGKTAVAVDLFGRAGIRLVPTLNQGSAGVQALMDELRTLGGVLSVDMIRNATEFNDQLTRLKELSKAGGQSILADLLPSLQAMTIELIEGRKAFGSFWEATKTVGWETSPFNSMAANIDNVSKQIQQLRAEAAGMRVEMGEDYARPYDERAAKLQKLLDYLQRVQRAEALIGSGGTENLDPRDLRLRNLQRAAEGTQSHLGVPNEVQAQRADKFLQQLNMMVTKSEQGEIASLRAQEDLLHLTGEQRTEADKLIDRLQRQQDITALIKRDAASITKDVEDQAKAAQSAAAFTGTGAGGIASAREQIDNLTKTNAEILKSTELKKLDTAYYAAMAGQDEANMATLTEAWKLYRSQLGETLDELQQRSRDWSTGWQQAMRDYVEASKDGAMQAKKFFSDMTTGMEDNLVNFIMKGKADWKGFLDTLVADLLRAQIKKLLADQMGGGGGFGAFLGMLGGVLGFTAGGGGTPVGNYSLTTPAPGGSTPRLPSWGGGSALGGSFQAGTAMMVGELGPELVVTGAPGRVVSNADLMTGTRIISAPTINIDARTDQATVYGIVRGAIDESNRQLWQSMQRRGAFAQ